MDALDSPPQVATPPKDAIDEFIALPQDQQLSTLQGLAPDKQDSLLAKVKERRASTKPQPDFFQTAKDNFNAATQGAQLGDEAVKGFVKNVGAGGGGVLRTVGHAVLHPIDTAQTMSDTGNALAEDMYQHPLEAIGKAVVGPSLQAGKQIIDIGKGLISQPGRTIGQLGAGTILGEGAGAATSGVMKAVPKVARAGADIIAGTGPKVAEGVVADTADANAAAQAKADAANADLATKRTQQLQQHFAKTQTISDANDAAAAAQSRKAALQRGVETLDPIHKTDLQSLEGTVRAEANRRYNDLNSQLDDKIAPPATIGDILSDASEAMKGSNTETPIMKDMENRFIVNGGHLDQAPVTYRDLQGYRSEIGRELQKGSLPGDVYHAYKGMQSAITDAMQNLAEENGLGDDFTNARSYYKQMSDTFDKPTSPIRKALNSTEPGGVVKAFAGKDKSGIEALAKYDPDLASRINTTRGYAAEAKGIRSSSASPRVAPTLPPKPPPVVPDITQVGPDEIQAAKADALRDRAESIRTKGHGVANTIAILDGLRNAFHGNLTGIATDVAARGGLSALQHAAAATLERPAVVEWLSRPTAADLAQLESLPASQRTAAAQSLHPLIAAAKAKGIPVAARIVAFAGPVVGATQGLPSSHPLATSQPTQ